MNNPSTVAMWLIENEAGGYTSIPQIFNFEEEQGVTRMPRVKMKRTEEKNELSEMDILYSWMEMTLNNLYDAASMVFLRKRRKEYQARLDLYIGNRTPKQMTDETDEILSSIDGYMPYKGTYAYFLDGDSIKGVTSYVSGYGEDADLAIKGTKEFVKEVVDKMKSCPLTVKLPQVLRVTHDGKSYDNGVFNLDTIEDKGVDFYPYLDITPEQLWEDFAKSNANVILMIGEPGTGKSSFLRRMLDARGYENPAHLVDNETLLLDPMLINYLQGEKDMKLLIAEDADNFVAKREDNNRSMVGLLNMSSGVASGNSKIVLSTNLSNISKVDPALIRPGRCYQVITFNKLTADQANEIRAALGIDEVAEHSMTLAETINVSNGSKEKTVSFGFGNLS